MLVDQFSSIKRRSILLICLTLIFVALMLIQACNLPSLPAVPGGLETPTLGGSDSGSDSSSTGTSGGGGGEGCQVVHGLNPNNLYRVSHVDPGPDGVWFTDDDPIVTYTAYEGAGSTGARSRDYSGSGSDGAWFSSDDEQSSYMDYSCDSRHHLQKSVGYFEKGSDDSWQTSDDVISFYSILAESGNRFLYYSSSGSDKEWFTSDDELTSYTDADFENYACPTSDISYDAEGNIVAYNTYSENSEGSPEQGVSYSSYDGGAGEDGVWFTSDDVISGYIKFSYNVDNVATRVVMYSSSGADGKWFTSDDVQSGYMDYLYR